ncbi:unnamed protein product [Adineta steineri]|uniref:F-box domain-containing protein n=1 Tax=Adineta steineri TaxID=433720 RepID=A0A814ITK3_9BILA|nr:unnamed protein product [Adineta steineri]
MEQIKRQLCDNFEENKRKKFITKSDCNVTQIEDLANELIYEIFEYLNSYNIYQSFFHLNHRFRSLLVESFLPLKIHIPLISSSSFDSYNQDMIMPNKQRIHSIKILNTFMRKNYELHSEITAENENQIIFKSVDLVQIQNEMAINQCMDYFPNTTQLTLSDGFSISTYRSIESGLNRILPLQQIKTLVIQCHHFSFLKMIKLLSYIPNLHRLTFQTMPLFKENKISIEQNEQFQSLCKTNSVATVTFRQICTLDKVQILIILFPHLQHLVMNIQMKDMELILRFLLNKNNHNLVLLSFKPASGVYFAHLNHLIKSGALASDHRRLHAYRELHLWW